MMYTKGICSLLDVSTVSSLFGAVGLFELLYLLEFVSSLKQCGLLIVKCCFQVVEVRVSLDY